MIDVEWREIEGSPNYMISSKGQPASVIDGVFRELTIGDNGKGYKNVSLGRGRREYIHRLVAMAFIPNPNNYKEINHIDGDKSNNAVENLEWCDRSHNLKHAYANDLHDPSNAVIAMKKSHSKPVRIIETGQEFDSVCECARYLKTPHGNLNQCLDPNIRTRHTCKGYHLEYANKDDMKIINSFPGYEFVYDEKDKKYHNMYRGTDLGFGGYIISNPGIYVDVGLLDIASLHPNSMINMNYFGEYTQNYKDLLDARIAIKHGDFDAARHMLGGRLAKYLDDESQAKDLAQATKIALNSCYGLTAASFENPMRDNRNKNNIVALRGSLFMRTLQDEVEARGYEIVAIKTDSIKIANATKEIVDFCMDFAKSYGYTFEFEAFYDRMCQINDADYVAKYKDPERCKDILGYIPGDNNKHGGEWTATGKQFQIPYVFKKLFSKEEIVFEDLCEVKEVKTALYLDLNEHLPDVSGHEAEFEKLEDKYKKGKLSDTLFESRCKELNELIEEGHDYHFIGKVGNFCPIKPGCGGGVLVAKRGDKYNSAAGAKGYRWLEAEMVKEAGREADIDRSYYDDLVTNMAHSIAAYGDLEWFLSDDPTAEPFQPEPEEPKVSDDFMNPPVEPAKAEEEEIELPWN